MEENARASESDQLGYSEPGKKTKVLMVIAAAAVAFYFAYSYAAYLKAPSESYAYGSSAAGRQAGYASSSSGGYAGGCCGSGGSAYGGAGTYGSAGSASPNAGGAASGGCCGGGSGGPQITKEARVEGNGQVVDMIVNGGWNPNVIKAKAGLPLTINLDVQQAGGCISALVFPQFNISVPLQSGAKTKVELPLLKPGTYGFSCQIGMVNGQLVVE